jgi:hypothetical protein
MATNDDTNLGQDPDDGDLENLHTTYDCLDRALMLGEPAEVRLAAETALVAPGEFLNRTPRYPVFTSRPNLDLWW